VTCGVPSEVIERVKAQHNKAEQIAKQVCKVAAWRPIRPSLWDGLGTPTRLHAPAPLCSERTLASGIPCVY
jgi:hypothetical protein